MGRVEELEGAIENLPPEEYRRIVQWFRAREQSRWDDQLDSDSSTGELDFLFDEAESESTNVSGRRQREIRRYRAVLGTVPGIAI
jgi:hypothetical protein